jgi:hypothetical protein
MHRNFEPEGGFFSEVLPRERSKEREAYCLRVFLNLRFEKNAQKRRGERGKILFFPHEMPLIVVFFFAII